MNVRLATVQDVPEVVRVTNAAYRVEDFFINGDRTNADEVRERMTKANAGFLVADALTGLAASVYFEVRGDRGYFGMLSVDPAHQKRGHSKALIAAVESHCRAAGCVALDIDVVNLRLELPAYYAALGFVETGTAPFENPRAMRPAHLITMSRPID